MKQNCYALIVVLDPRMSENSVKDLILKVKNMISSVGGEILTEDNWGIKKVAHPIKKNREGLYYFMKIKIDGSKISELRYNLKVSDGILRASVIKSSIEVVK